jgi:hypothetical protein
LSSLVHFPDHAVFPECYEQTKNNPPAGQQDTATGSAPSGESGSVAAEPAPKSPPPQPVPAKSSASSGSASSNNPGQLNSNSQPSNSNVSQVNSFSPSSSSTDNQAPTSQSAKMQSKGVTPQASSNSATFPQNQSPQNSQSPSQGYAPPFQKVSQPRSTQPMTAGQDSNSYNSSGQAKQANPSGNSQLSLAELRRRRQQKHPFNRTADTSQAVSSEEDASQSFSMSTPGQGGIK